MNNDNLFITDYLALSICNKKIRYNEGKNLNQDVNYIYAFTYVEAIHEIAHWIAAEPNSRNFLLNLLEMSFWSINSLPCLYVLK